MLGSEQFWLELTAKVFDAPVALVSKEIQKGRARVKQLVKRILHFHVRVGFNQEQSVEAILSEVHNAKALYQSSKALYRHCKEWKRAMHTIERRIEVFHTWQFVRKELDSFLNACHDTFNPPDDSYNGWISVRWRNRLTPYSCDRVPTVHGADGWVLPGDGCLGAGAHPPAAARGLRTALGTASDEGHL